VSILAWRLVYINLIESPRFYKRVLMVAEVSNLDGLVSALKNSDPNYKIVGFINSEASTQESIKFKGLKEFKAQDFLETINKERISEVLVASFNTEAIIPEVYHDLILLLERGFKIREYTQVYEELLQKVPIQFVGKDFYKYFPFSRSNENKLYIFFQRAFDIIISLVGLTFGFLLLPFIVFGNSLGNKGPLFYTQERIGKNGKPFKILKLRTMIINAEVDGVKWASKNDKRVTKFGKFLRRSRIDEIPQFYNVLIGDMSMIGPRPERPFFVNELSRIIPFYETRHIIKPGLTGWAQVNSRYGSSIDDSLMKLQYDLYYIKHRSLFLDLSIIVKTLSTILYYRGQ
jgi:exopolysaccharide biosynthesis polyprenyl glycosylphosphotransferase